MSGLGWSDSVGRTNFKNDSHAYKTGMFIGHLQQKGMYADPILDTDGNYTPRIHIHGSPFGRLIIEVLPPEEEAG
jgi:hypothetical protein